MPTENSHTKKQKVVDLPKLAQEAWEHYRNYLDSMEGGEDDEEEQNEEGDIDELQAIIDLVEPHLRLDNTSQNPVEAAEVADSPWKSVVDLLPVLVSVAYNNLAEAAIAEYLHMVEHTKNMNENTKEDNEAVILAEKAKNVQSLLQKSLQAFGGNAATWSMGANFGRMSHRLSLATTREWYEKAVVWAVRIRAQAVTLLEDETIEDPLLKEWTELMLLNHMVGVEFEDDEEDENDSDDEDIDQDEKENDEAEEEGHYSVSAVEATARFMCAMLWSMQGDHDKAASHLQHFDVTHRLHPNVWNIAELAPALSSPPKAAPLVFKPDSGVLPKHLYNGMKTVFAPDSAYWKESNYAGRGYYSFFMEYDPTASFVPQNLIEDVIVNHLLPRAQQTLDMSSSAEGVSDEENKTICGFEWWTHTRPIQANLGHNLHFDTDESILAQEGKVTHPILSSVLYVTGGDDPKERPSGSTILLDQTPDSTAVAEYCWQGTPHDNSFMIFPGNLLHGVLPCPGKAEPESDGNNKTAELWNDWIEPKDGTATEDVVNRLTFMVGFWTRNVPAGMKDRRLYGPCGPLPPATEEHSWVQQISKGYADNGKGVAASKAASEPMVPTALPRVSPAWEVLPSSTKLRAAPATKGGKSPKEQTDTLKIPYGIDHRFFVKDAPKCFRDSLFEDKKDCEVDGDSDG